MAAGAEVRMLLPDAVLASERAATDGHVAGFRQLFSRPERALRFSAFGSAQPWTRRSGAGSDGAAGGAFEFLPELLRPKQSGVRDRLGVPSEERNASGRLHPSPRRGLSATKT
mmetsp:Transcript_47995/g.154855  ORF Transcript_47995/g.154855 Transcript_47995/m.154855 type:complete len:113 (+) Transcript_47995:503-841(+)